MTRCRIRSRMCHVGCMLMEVTRFDRNFGLPMNWAWRSICTRHLPHNNNSNNTDSNNIDNKTILTTILITILTIAISPITITLNMELVLQIRRRTTAITKDSRETIFLFQRLSVALHRGNAVSFLATFPHD